MKDKLVKFIEAEIAQNRKTQNDLGKTHALICGGEMQALKKVLKKIKELDSENGQNEEKVEI